METIPYWRNIYQSISGRCENVTTDDVIILMEEIDSDLTIGLMQYKPFTDQSLIDWKLANADKEKKKKDFELLVERVSRSLNLDTKIAWSLICNYLMFEYYGKVEDLQEVVRYASYTNALLEKISHFYLTERLFVLKTLRYILENSKYERHRLHPAYKHFMRKHDIPELRTQLFEQFLSTIYEVTALPDTILDVQEWIDRNMHEQLEIVLTILASIHAEKIPIDQIIEMLKTFMEHGFTTRPPECLKDATLEPAVHTTLKNMQNMEFACFLLGVQQFWNGENFAHCIDEMEEILQHLNFPLLTLIWSVLNTTLDYDTICKKFEEKYQYWISGSMMRNALGKLGDILATPILKDTQLEVILKSAAFDFFTQTCVKFDCCGHLYSKPGTVDFFEELLKLPEFAYKALDFDTPVYSVYHSTRMMFPADFTAFTRLSSQLVEASGYIDQILDALLNMEVFTIEFKGTIGPMADIYKIVSDLRPYRSNNVIIPADSVSRVLRVSDKVFLKFRSLKYSYFTILQEKMNIVLNGNLRTTDPAFIEALDDALLGLDFLLRILKQRERIVTEPSLKVTINYVKYLATTFSLKNVHLLKLSSKCFEVCVAMMSMLHKDLLQTLFTSEALPFYKCEKLRSQDIPDQLVLEDSNILKMIYHESSHETHELFFAYVAHIEAAQVTGWYFRKIQIPGMVFLLHNIFPTHTHWVYGDEHEVNRVTHRILKMLMKILHKKRETLKNNELLHYEFCLNTFLNFEGFIKSFINVLRTSNTRLEKMMCKETNWKSGQMLEYVDTVRTCISIVIMVLSCTTDEELKKSKFWKFFIYSGPNYSSIIKTITDYINNKYSRGLTKIAARLLNKVAEDTSVPIIAHLEMDNYQVQCMFLERLRDSLENDDLKINLLSLIKTCVISQPGMTAAFFNLSFTERIFKSNETKTVCDNVTEYMTEYLHNIDKSSAESEGLLQSAVLDLFHTIWIEKKTSLISNILENGTFWSTITVPMSQLKYSLMNITYTQILEIMATQIVRASHDEAMKTALQKLLSESSYFCPDFPKHVETRTQDSEADDSALALLVAWKMFLVFAIKSKIDIFTDECKLSLVTSNLEGLRENLKYPRDVRIVANWGQLCLYLLTKWDSKIYETDANFDLLTETLQCAAICYSDLDNESQLAIATIAMKSVRCFSSFTNVISKTGDNYLIAIGTILEKEYDLITIRKKKPESAQTCSEYMPMLFLILFGRELINVTTTVHRKWFYLTHYLEKTMMAIARFAKRSKTLILAKVATNCLITCANSPVGDNFLMIDMDAFYYKTYPKQYLDISTFSFGTGEHWHYEDFWQYYNLLLQFNLVLLNKFGYNMFHKVSAFFHMHKDVILTIMRLPQVVAECSALLVTTKALQLIHRMLFWQADWFLAQELLVITFFKGIAEVLNSCLNIFIRPRILKYFTFDKNLKLRPVEDIPMDILTNTMTKVAGVVTAACLCVLNVSPHMLDYFGFFDYRKSYHITIVKDFSLPNIGGVTGVSNSLTYGSLMNLAQFLCKAESQLHLSNIKKTPVHIERPKFMHVLNDDIVDMSLNSLVFVNTDFLVTYRGVAGQFSTAQQFNPDDNYSKQSQWCAQMDKEILTSALETVLTVIATHVFKSVYEAGTNPRKQELLKREMSSELQFYHDYIRRRMSEQYRLCVKKQVSENPDAPPPDFMLACLHWFTVVCRLGP